MKAFIFSLLFISQIFCAQKNHKKVFNMQIMAPKQINIPVQLNNYTDTIKNNSIKSFYYRKNKLKELIEFKDYPKDMAKDFEITKKNAQEELNYMNDNEEKLKNINISNEFLYSASILNMIFNEYEPYSKIEGINYRSEPLKNIENYCNEKKLDYFMYYENPQINFSNNKYSMSTYLKVYSKKQNRIIIDKEIIGDTNSYGDMWTCTNPLSCLIITSLKNSLECVVEKIRK